MHISIPADLFETPVVPLQRTASARRLAQAKEVQAFIAAHGRRPRPSSKDSAERSLYGYMNKIRQEFPSIAAHYGFLAHAMDVPHAPTGPRRKQQSLPSISERICALAREFPYKPLVAGGFSGTFAASPEVCQATTPTRCNAEIVRDCWWFTLRGQTKPDLRDWKELFAASDNVLIEKAERVAYLDFEKCDVAQGPHLLRAPRRPF
jgi:hypothetical protein